MAQHRTLRLHATRRDVAACRRAFAESLRLPATAEDANSVSYRAGDAILILDWTLDHGAADPAHEVVLLVDEIGPARGVMEALGARLTGAGPSVSCALPDGSRLTLLELSDECLMWPSAGWRAGPSAVVPDSPPGRP